MFLHKLIYIFISILSITAVAEELKSSRQIYDVGYKIGSGRRGQVYIAKDDHGNTVAIKKLYTKQERKEKGDSSAELKRIYDVDGVSLNGKRAYRNGRVLKHPNICRSYELIIEGERTWVIMEYVQGSTVANVEHRSLDKQVAIKLALQYLDSLEYITHQGFYHGDLYGHNFMISNDMEFKVIDLDAIKLLTGQDSNNHNIRLEDYFTKTHVILWEILNTGNFTNRELENARNKFQSLVQHKRFEKNLHERASPFLKSQILDYFAGLRSIIKGEGLPSEWVNFKPIYWF